MQPRRASWPTGWPKRGGAGASGTRMATAPVLGPAARAGSPPTREAAMAADPVAPKPAKLAARTDSYFLQSKAIVGHFRDRGASYAVFMRRPVTSAPRFAVQFLETLASARGTRVEVEIKHH